MTKRSIFTLYENVLYFPLKVDEPIWNIQNLQPLAIAYI